MTGRSSERSFADTWIAPATAAVVAALVFLRSLFGAFVFDDPRFITENEFVTRPSSWWRLVADSYTACPKAPGGIVRPLRTVEYAADWSLFGNSPFAFHVHSLLWHVAAAALLVVVLRRILGDGRAALVAGLLWAVHPVQVESAAWISSRGDVAMGAWSLAAVLFALRSRGFDRDLAVSLVATLVAALYKETAVALPLVMAALRWTRFSRAPLWPYFALVAGYLVYWRAVQRGPIGHGPIFVLGGSTAGTFATMFRGFGFYLVESLLPAQSLDWHMAPSTSLIDAAALAWLAVHAAVLASACVARRTAPAWTLAVAWFYAFLGPVANWPIFLSIPTAERFLYVPLVGFAIAVGWALRRAPRGAWTAALVAMAAFVALSIDRIGMWRTNDTMWRGVLADHDGARAREYAGETSRDRVLAMLPEILKMPPGPELESANAEYRRLCEDALDQFHRSLALARAFEMSKETKSFVIQLSEFQASNMCWFLRRDEESLFHAEESLRVDDAHFAQPHYDKAQALARLLFAPQAMESMRRSREIGDSSASDEMGRFFRDEAAECERQGMFVEARRGYETAVAASPAGPLQEEARTRLAALRATPRAADAEARERARRKELDAALERLPRSCPWRHDPPPVVPDTGMTALLAWSAAALVATAAAAGVTLLARRKRRSGVYSGSSASEEPT